MARGPVGDARSGRHVQPPGLVSIAARDALGSHPLRRSPPSSRLLVFGMSADPALHAQRYGAPPVQIGAIIAAFSLCSSCSRGVGPGRRGPRPIRFALRSSPLPAVRARRERLAFSRRSSGRRRGANSPPRKHTRRCHHLTPRGHGWISARSGSIHARPADRRALSVMGVHARLGAAVPAFINLVLARPGSGSRPRPTSHSCVAPSTRASCTVCSSVRSWAASRSR